MRDNLKPAIVALTFVLSSCMVGPNFHSPCPPKIKSYTASPLPKKTIMGMDIPGEWWKLYHSQPLNRLIQTGLDHSPNLAAAQATLREAQETLRAQVGTLLLPSVDAGIDAERSRISGLSFGSGSPSSIFNVYNASVNVSYTLDLFGGSRRLIEAYRSQVDYQRYELIATYLTLTSNIVTTAITIASLQDQIDTTHELIRLQQSQMDIINKQLQLGGVSDINRLTQLTQLAETQALLPPLEKNLAQSRHALAVLTGIFPSESQIPRLDLEHLQLPPSLPISLPSNLVRQRPDIMASEALLHTASAQVGVATANLFPQITLSGNYGWTSDIPSTLFHPQTNVWGFSGQLLQPIFHGGALQAQKRAAIAAYDQANAQYQQTVLQAFKNVADTLRALEMDTQSLGALKKAEAAAKNTLVITQKQYRLGGVSYLSLLTATQQYQQTRINRVQAQAARLADTAALFQALGGGWWNRCHPT